MHKCVAQDTQEVIARFSDQDTHYYDGPDPERWRKQNEKEFKRRLLRSVSIRWDDRVLGEVVGECFRNTEKASRTSIQVLLLWILMTTRRQKLWSGDGLDPALRERRVWGTRSVNLVQYNERSRRFRKRLLLIHAPHGGKYTMTVTNVWCRMVRWLWV